MDITGSVELYLSHPSTATDSATFTFTGTTLGILRFNWDLTDIVTIGGELQISANVSVSNPGDSVRLDVWQGYEADPAFINATTDGNPVFT